MKFIFGLPTALIAVLIVSKPQGSLAILPTLDVSQIGVLHENDGAIRVYSKIDKISAANDLLQQGGEKYKKGDYQGAIADYTKALQLNPKSAQAYNYRGNARLNLRDKQGAIDDYNQAIKLAPKSADAYNNRGDGRSALGDNQGAITDYNQAIQIDPYYAKAYANRGSARYSLGDRQDALADLQQAATLAQQQNNAVLYQNIQDTMRGIR